MVLLNPSSGVQTTWMAGVPQRHRGRLASPRIKTCCVLKECTSKPKKPVMLAAWAPLRRGIQAGVQLQLVYVMHGSSATSARRGARAPERRASVCISR